MSERFDDLLALHGRRHRKSHSRSPYDGWEERAAEGPEAFIRFIGPIYNPAGGAYVALITKAQERLAKANAAPALPPPIAGTTLVIVIDPGHGGTVTVSGSSPINAKSPSAEKEKDWTLDIAKRTRAAVLARAVTDGINVEVILTRETDSNKCLAARGEHRAEQAGGSFSASTSTDSTTRCVAWKR